MYRHLSRITRRWISGSKNVAKDQNRVRRNARESMPLSKAFSSSQDYFNFKWSPQPGTRHAQLQIVNALRLGERERARKMLLNIGDACGFLGPDDFVFVLEYCAETPDPLFVMETWRIMEEKAVAINTKCCRSIVQAFSKGGYLKEACNWLTFVGEIDFAQSVLPLYNNFLSECWRSQSFIDADRCLDLMEGQLVGKSEITYWELLKFAVLQKNLSAVHEIWKDCTKYYSPSIVTLRKFILSFTRLNALEPAYVILQHMIALAHQESASLRTSSAGRYHSSRLDIPIPSYNESLDEILESEGTSCSHGILPEAIMETRAGLQGSCSEPCNEENQSFHDVGKDLRLGRFNFIPYLAPHNIGSRNFNPSRKDKNLRLPSYPVDSSGSDNQYSMQQDFTKLNWENMKRGQESGMFKARGCLPVKNILRWSFNNVIHACARAKNCELAEHLFTQ